MQERDRLNAGSLWWERTASECPRPRKPVSGHVSYAACKGNPLEGLGKRGTVIKLQFRLKKNKQNDQTPMTAVGK